MTSAPLNICLNKTFKKQWLEKTFLIPNHSTFISYQKRLLTSIFMGVDKLDFHFRPTSVDFDVYCIAYRQTVWTLVPNGNTWLQSIIFLFQVVAQWWAMVSKVCTGGRWVHTARNHDQCNPTAMNLRCIFIRTRKF